MGLEFTVAARPWPVVARPLQRQAPAAMDRRRCKRWISEIKTEKPSGPSQLDSHDARPCKRFHCGPGKCVGTRRMLEEVLTTGSRLGAECLQSAQRYGWNDLQESLHSASQRNVVATSSFAAFRGYPLAQVFGSLFTFSFRS